MAKTIAIKYPGGYRGIVHADTREDNQEELFMPTDNRLISVNQPDCDWEMGSLVCDLNDKNEIDPDRSARLQSAFRVVKYPFGEPNCSIAFQLGPTGQQDTKGGYFIDRLMGSLGDTTAVIGNSKSIGQGSYLEGGPFDVGTGKCKHRNGQDDDGNPISSLHISTKGLFRKNDIEDGPLRFEGPFADADNDTGKRIKVHLSWSGGDWFWWTRSLLYPVIPEPLKPSTPTPGIPKNDPARPPISSVDPKQGKTISSSSLTGDVFNLIASFSPLCAAVLTARPQNYITGSQDFGTFSQADESGLKKAKGAPITGAMSAFGAQGGSMPSGGSGGGNSQTGASGDPWNYNQFPKGWKTGTGTASKYLGGTSSGGWVIHPPETDLRDTSMAPSNVTLSTTLFVVAPGAWFGCGLPQLVNGSIKDGFTWGVEASTGDLVFRSHSNSQAASEAMRFTKTAQNYQWRSGTSFNGILDHANTANRTYTFPDASITVAGASGSAAANQVAYWSDAFTLAGSANFTFNGATGATTIAQWLNVGTVTNAAVQGDFAVGRLNSNRIYWDFANDLFNIYGLSTANPGVQLLNSSGTAHWAVFEVVGAAGAQGVFRIRDQVAGLGTDRVIIFTSGNVGINQTNDRSRRLDILDAVNPQLRLTQADNSTYADLQTTPSGDFNLTMVGGGVDRTFSMSQSISGGTLGCQLYNSSNTASSFARAYIVVGGTSAADPFTRYQVVSGTDWSIGIHNSDSRKFKISNNSTLGTNDYLTILTAGSVVLNNAALATNATDGWIYLTSSNGTPTGTPTAFTGRVPYNPDTSNYTLHHYIGAAWRAVSGNLGAASTPTQIAANQNDYAFAGGRAAATFQRVSSDAARNITGISAVVDGTVIWVSNVGAFTITLQNQNAGSAAANRIITGTGADLAVAADQTVALIYDGTTARWRVLKNA